MSADRTRSPAPLKPHHCITGRQHATAIIYRVCCLAGSTNLLDEKIHARLHTAVAHSDTRAIYNWWVEALSFQGISDQAASAYWNRYGGITWETVEQSIKRRPSCAKLKNYWSFYGCGYSKSAKTCSEPYHFRNCPLPKHNLRNGRINQTAYSLYLFTRDIADRDLVPWIERRLHMQASQSGKPDARPALLEPLKHVFGVAEKTLSMTLATLLLSAAENSLWTAAGAEMVAIDRLVHNFLARTGILKRLNAEHEYGPACVRPSGCEDIVRLISRGIDASTFNRAYPTYFPRFIQHSIWSFCSLDGHNVCNGVRINDRKGCRNPFCRVNPRCDRLVLKRKGEKRL